MEDLVIAISVLILMMEIVCNKFKSHNLSTKNKNKESIRKGGSKLIKTTIDNLRLNNYKEPYHNIEVAKLFFEIRYKSPYVLLKSPISNDYKH